MFLPTTAAELRQRGWDAPDFVLITGDAYVDHPSFGAAIIGRVLEREGFTVGIIAQPQSDSDFLALGKPRLGVFVTSGNLDSMVAHYTAAKRRRSQDAYSPGGQMGLRPDRALDVYCQRVRRLWGDTPLIIGGLEASLRRFAHYDYWSDSVRPSALISTDADILVFGMGEAQTAQLARRLAQGEEPQTLRDMRGICYRCAPIDTPWEGVECPSLANVVADKKEYAKACRLQQGEQDAFRGKRIKQRHGQWMLVQNPPAVPLDTAALDALYTLPFERMWHPRYAAAGGVPALAEVEFSLTHNRGCFGDCNFCSLAFHQGRYITARSRASLLQEAALLTKRPGFKGYIHDVGGPTANFRAPSCAGQEERGLCKGKKCLAPEPCARLQADHSEYLEILRALRQVLGVKKVFIRSGIRFDYLLADESDAFFRELVAHHVSGQLKVAPEHCSAVVLDAMGKPHIESYLRFAKRFFALTKQADKEQYLVPYLMSSHPGCGLREAVELAQFLKAQNIRPEQVQDFYPTPGTVSTCMFYTGLDPLTMQEVPVAKTAKEKALQRALLQYYLPKNRALVQEAQRLTGMKI